MSDIVERLRNNGAAWANEASRDHEQRFIAFAKVQSRTAHDAANEIECLLSENAAVCTRLAEAEKVIEPFARAAACAGTAWPDNGLPSHVVGLVNLGHLRAARAWKEASNG